jgi:hypothetical protein
MNIFKTRNDFINSLVTNMVICELGVFQGDFSEVLFSHNPKEQLPTPNTLNLRSNKVE